MIDDITVMPWLYPPASGWTYRILYTSADNRTNRIIVLDNKVTINIANADSITVTNRSNHKTAVLMEINLKV